MINYNILYPSLIENAKTPINQEWNAEKLEEMRKAYYKSSESEERKIFGNSDLYSAINKRLNDRSNNNNISVDFISFTFSNDLNRSFIIVEIIIRPKNKNNHLNYNDKKLIYELVNTKDGWKIIRPPHDYDENSLLNAIRYVEGSNSFKNNIDVEINLD